MTTNIAEVLKLAAKPVQYDNDERTWLEFRFKLENYLTLVEEKYVQLLRDAESQPVANLPAGGDETSVTIRTLNHTLYALLATLTTGRSLRLVQRVPNRNGFEVWRQLVTENAPKTAGRRFAMLQAVLQPGMSNNPVKFEETWKSWEHQLEVYENLATSKLDDDVKISVVLREAPQKLRDHLLVNSQQFESDYSKLKAIIQAYLNTNKTWITNDFRESDPMEVDHIGKGKSKGKGKGKTRSRSKSKSRDRCRSKGKSKSKSKGKGKDSEKPDNERECYVCGKRGHFARDCWSRANHDKMVNEVEAEDVNAKNGEEVVFTIENVINDVTLSQDGYAEREGGLVMVDSGASVNVCPKLFGKSKLKQSDGVTCLRGANGKPLQEYGKRQIWLKIGGKMKRYDFHVVDVTKPILSVSYLCEHGIETHLAEHPFLRFGDGHEPLIRKGGVYFVRAQTVNAVETMTSNELMDCQNKIQAYELMDCQNKIHAYELMDCRNKIHAYELMD